MTELPIWKDVKTLNGTYSVKLDEPLKTNIGWTLRAFVWNTGAVDIIGTVLPDGNTSVTARSRGETVAHASVSHDHLFAYAPDRPDGTLVGCKVPVVLDPDDPEPLMLAAVEAVTRVIAALMLLEA